MTMRRGAAALVMLMGCALPGRSAAAGDDASAAPAERPVDLVLRLDTSNSMDGLTDDGLAGAVRAAVRKQAERKGFTFDGC